MTRNYSRLLELNVRIDELAAILCDQNPSEDQLFQAKNLLTDLISITDQMDPSDDGYYEIYSILTRLKEAVIMGYRFARKVNDRWHTTIERSIVVLTSVVSSRLSLNQGNSNVRQCIESLDALLGTKKRQRKVQ